MNNLPQNQPPVYSSPISAATQGAGTTALVLEAVFGIFGLLGIGHVFTGRVRSGIGLLLGWWVYMVVAFFVSLVTLGFAACLFIPISIAVPVISGIQARTHIQQTGGTGSWPSVAKVAGGGCLTMILAVVLLIIFGGVLSAVQGYR